MKRAKSLLCLLLLLLLLRLRLRNRSRRKIGVQRTGKVTHELRCLFVAHRERTRDVNDLSLL